MSEEKIGMYTTKEIYEEIANGFLHRSMVDAMYFKIKDLQQKVERLEKENKKLKQWDVNKDTRNSRQRIANRDAYKKIEQLENIRKEAIEEIQRVLDIWTNKPNEIATLDLEYLLNILNKGSE